MNYKSLISLLLGLFTLFILDVEAQDIDRLSKSELREYANYLNKKISTLNVENAKLKDDYNKILLENTLLKDGNNKLTQDHSKVLTENELLLTEKNKLTQEHYKLLSENELLLSEKNKLKADCASNLLQQQENEVEIAKLKKELQRMEEFKSEMLAQKENEINTYDKEENNSPENFRTNQNSSNNSLEIKIQSNDFLNNYFFNQRPLNNNTFNLKLSKVIVGDTKAGDRYNSYDNDYADGTVERLPEILNAENLIFYKATPNIQNYRNKNKNDLVHNTTLEEFNAELPEIEILKNKLFTLNYKNGTQESFLYNIGSTYINGNNQSVTVGNNLRKALNIELANEEVKEDGSNNDAKDIIWRIYAIENECYLALSLSQLQRIQILIPDFSEDKYYYQVTSGKEYLLARKKDNFMSHADYLNPKELIYLFKLIEVK